MLNAYCEGPEALLANCGVAKNRKPCIHHQYEDIKKGDWGCLQDGLESTFTPLESPAIYGGDNINKASIIYRKGGVKAPSFLTGLTRPTNCFSKRVNS
jgi:hypothetical protein